MIYGKSATKRGVINVLDAILPHYKYASLAELNAVLKLYNINADRGSETGVIYKKRGLAYRVLDEKGNKIGVPIKASSIYSKPTLPSVNRISSLSSGEFIGMVTDNPEEKIELKSFFAEIINDHKALAQEQTAYKELPSFSTVQPGVVMKNYMQVKKDVAMIVEMEMERILDTPELTGLIIRKH